MAERVASPFESITVRGIGVPLYVLRFDKYGVCESPDALQDLIGEVRAGKFLDVHLYAHGWNNVFEVALKKYRRFFELYGSLQEGTRRPADLRRTALVGIIWPSTALVAPSERGAGIAAVSDGQTAILVDELKLCESAEKLVIAAEIGRADPREVADVLLPIFARRGDEPEDLGARTVEQVLDIAATAEAAHADGGSSYDEEFGYARAFEGGEVRAAALPDPRLIVRIATVLLMKDRAGVVGARGVGPHLMRPIAAIDGARVHGIGHSYGTKVMLSALCADRTTRLQSLLLLQGAVNRYCFAENIEGIGAAGGYRSALEQVVMPIVTTRSDADWELRSFFHLAVRRRSDVGEIRMAGIFDRYYALGGYGPEGVRAHARVDVDLRPPGDSYPAFSPARLCTVNGSNGLITGHGDVDNEATAWLHAELVGGGFSA